MAATAPRPAARRGVLNQNEIDSLLGFGDGDGATATRPASGDIDSALVSTERLPDARGRLRTAWSA